jgi:hypothetical protein
MFRIRRCEEGEKQPVGGEAGREVTIVPLGIGSTYLLEGT